MASLHTETAGPLYPDLETVGLSVRCRKRIACRAATPAVFTIGRSKGWMWGNRNQPLSVTVLMSVQPRPLEGRKILIVEDEAPIALSLAAGVAHAGGIAIGPAATVAAAFALMADHTLDGALLDIRLRGETSFSLADVLAVLGIPFVFVSGMSSALMPYPHRDRPLFDKPYEVQDVIATLARLLRPAATPAPSTSGATPGGSPR